MRSTAAPRLSGPPPPKGGTHVPSCADQLHTTAGRMREAEALTNLCFMCHADRHVHIISDCDCSCKAEWPQHSQPHVTQRKGQLCAALEAGVSPLGRHQAQGRFGTQGCVKIRWGPSWETGCNLDAALLLLGCLPLLQSASCRWSAPLDGVAAAAAAIVALQLAAGRGPAPGAVPPSSVACSCLRRSCEQHERIALDCLVNRLVKQFTLDDLQATPNTVTKTIAQGDWIRFGNGLSVLHG